MVRRRRALGGVRALPAFLGTVVCADVRVLEAGAMGRRVTGANRLRALVAAGVLPEGAEVNGRRREATWSERGFEMALLLEPYGPQYPVETGRWALWTSVPGRWGASVLEGGLAASVPVQPLMESTDPGESSWAFGTRFEELVTQARGFVTDMPDLIWLQSQQEEVARGELITWVGWSGFPARVIKSLVLAREFGDKAGEARALEIVHSGQRVSFYLDEVDILVVARGCADEVSKRLRVHVPLE
jgi:hypothetical protein